MICNLSSDFDRQKFRTYVDYLLKRQCIVELKEHKHQRSLAQNRYAHLLFSLFASETGNDLETVKHDIFKKIVNKDIFERARNNKYGVLTTYYRSTSDLDTGEFTLALERFRNWSANTAGIYLPEPNEHDAILEAQKQIALYEKYL